MIARSQLLSREFWQPALERAVSTVAQAGVGSITAAVAVGSFDWRAIGIGAAVAGGLSVLKAIAAVQITGTVSLTGAETPSSTVLLEQSPSGAAVAGQAAVAPTGSLVPATARVEQVTGPGA